MALTYCLTGPNAGANDVVINMGDLEVPGAGNNDGKKEAKETLFGPSIGVAGGGPDWCEKDSKDSKNTEEDELTPDIVKEWIRKSKDVSFYMYGLGCITTLCSFDDLNHA